MSNMCGEQRVMVFVAAVMVWLAVGVAPVLAQKKSVAGEYTCLQLKVAGKVVPCTTARLSLKSDGRFELQGREGDYLVNGNWVELDSAALQTRARLVAGHRIVFRFYNKKGACEVIYERRVAELGKTKLS